MLLLRKDKIYFIIVVNLPLLPFLNPEQKNVNNI